MVSRFVMHRGVTGVHICATFTARLCNIQALVRFYQDQTLGGRAGIEQVSHRTGQPILLPRNHTHIWIYSSSSYSAKPFQKVLR